MSNEFYDFLFVISLGVFFLGDRSLTSECYMMWRGM